MFGDYSHFTRSEMKVARVFRDVMTPVVFGISGSGAYASVSVLSAAV